MLQLPIYRDIVRPRASSQTTSNWSITAPESTQIVIEKASFNVVSAGSAVIKVLQEKSWDEVMEQVLRQRERTWRELAAL